MKQGSQNHLISIVMPVYNTAKFLPAALQSLQKQTHTNWELIAIDDHSSDDSWSILQTAAQKDARIKIYRNQRNRGVATTANHAVKVAKGQFIARMDSDDIASSTRLEKQVAYLLAHPTTVAVGGQCQVIDAKNQVIGEKLFPTDPAAVQARLFSFASIQQPTMMVNTQLLPKHFTWYESSLAAAEEHELLFKLLQFGQLANLPETVLKYRMHSANTSKRHPKKDFFVILGSRLKAIKKYGYIPTVKGIAINFLQLVVVGLLPSFLIHPLYRLMRGLQKQQKVQPALPRHLTKLPELSVFFPLHNEAENIRLLVKSALQTLPKVAHVFEIILVNDGSTDATSAIGHELAKKYPQVKIVDQPNMGYGGALKTGFAAAQYEWIFFSDGDLQFDLREIALLTEKARDSKVVIGYRLQRADALKRRVMAALLKIWNKIFFSFPGSIKDIDCAFKLFHSSVVKHIFPLQSRGAMISTEMLLKTVEAGYSIDQVGVTHLPRLHGTQTGARWDVVWGAIKETYYLFVHRTLKPYNNRFRYSSTSLAVLIALGLTAIFGLRQ